MARIYLRHLGTGSRCACPKQCGPDKARWTAVGDVGRDESGRRRQKTVGGFRTKVQAEKAWRDLLSSIDKGADPFATDVTVAAFMDRWLQHMATQIRPKSLQRYQDHVRLRITPALGGLKLSKMRVGHVQAAVDQWLAAGLAPRTVQASRMVLGRALSTAVKWQMIQVNPVLAVDIPKAERPKLTTPTPADMLRIIDAAEDTVWGPAVLLCASTGCRRGEALAARWADLDLTTGRLRIVGTMADTGDGRWAVMDPKTDRARRQIVVPAFALEKLKAHKLKALELRLATGGDWQPDLICHRFGEPLNPDTFSKEFRRIVTKAGLPSTIRLHDLRHGVATAMLDAGVHPAIASASLGHASQAFTMSVYQHVTDQMVDKAAVALEAAFGAEGGQS